MAADGMPGSMRVDVLMHEWSSSEPLALSDRDLEMIDREINAERQQLQYEYEGDGLVSVQTTHYVGLVSLPDGPTLEIRPKAAGENLLSLFRYAQGIASTTIERETAMPEGREFVDALAALYVDELRSVVQRGLFTEYQSVSGTEEYLRGRLDVQRQLQRQGTTGTQFECEYEELTADTPANRAILYATSILGRLVNSPGIRRSLHQYESRLRRQVTLIPVEATTVERIELSRLNEHYADLLRLAELVIRGVFVENFVSGDRPSFAILMDMNQVYEAVVERAARNAVGDREGWRVEGQAHVQGLITGGKHPVRMRPDFVVRNEATSVLLVGDAKWKLGTPSQADLDQLTAYQLADDVPGLLVYPAQGGAVTTQYTVRERFPLRLIELPTDATVDSYAEFSDLLETTIGEEIVSLIS